ncbi:MAG TPA: glucosamine-6-phosphate isomerase [Bacteroidetes bacterium]|nr:glucosamine-6-phosphate isomerase [Bacteroidota bacterium]
MSHQFKSGVENTFYNEAGTYSISTRVPYIVVDNFPRLGLLTALRFIEWISENPEGVISLPTGKTPEYFIKYTRYLVDNWNRKEVKDILSRYDLGNIPRPETGGLHFVQMDEFYPINPVQHNSFFNYVNRFYIDQFGLDRSKCLTMNSVSINLPDNMHYREVFPDLSIDLSLRFREAKTRTEEIQQKAIFMIDNWCSTYEQQVRDIGGLGFFLGGIGPDGHIAFNTRGSDLFSTTRLTATNFETQAVAAGDLGGIEVSRNRLVITIGLETITYNPAAVAIIFAAGEAKAGIIKDALENEMNTLYPATALQRLENSVFYLTGGAASALDDRVEMYFNEGEWSDEKSEKAVINLCQKLDKYSRNLSLDDLKNDKYCSMIPGLDKNTVTGVVDSVKAKIMRGIEREENKVIYHTGPHHDDIMLGILPGCIRQVRSATNDVHFCVLTSGFTSVTDQFMESILLDTLKLVNEGEIQMIYYPDFFDGGYKIKWYKDVYHYLNATAQHNYEGMRRGICHRVVRGLVEIWKLEDKLQMIEVINLVIKTLHSSYKGSKSPEQIQKLKGMVREFEEELVWAHFGVPIKNIHHLRLGFYKGDIFTEQPEHDRDVEPILDQLRQIKPGIISLALDPEGSGPDTHYKVLQAIASAVKEWGREKDLSELRVMGYRNVWYRFHPAEVNTIVPVSLNSMAVLESSFEQCYGSQVHASFPSYEYDGKFSDLTRKIWVEQLKQVQLLTGKGFFYESDQPILRATHGLVYMKDMSADEFIAMAKDLEKLMEGVIF